MSERGDADCAFEMRNCVVYACEDFSMVRVYSSRGFSCVELKSMYFLSIKIFFNNSRSSGSSAKTDNINQLKHNSK